MADLRIRSQAGLRAELAKISLLLLKCRYGCANCLTLAVAQTLVIAKEKSFVFLDGPAESSAELIALQGLDTRGKKAFGVHGVVPQKFPGRAMKCVRAGARNDVGR